MSTGSVSPRPPKLLAALPYLLIGVVAAAVYGAFLEMPIFFDDLNYFSGRDFSQSAWHLDEALKLRWLPYTSFDWSVAIFGESLFWLRLGNLVLHILNGWVLLAFLRRLYQAVAVDAAPGGRSPARQPPLDPRWLAFFAALIFVVHPVATFGVGYLVQRSILMATFFALLTWWFFLEGISRNRRRWLFASCLTYLLSGLCKEHAILVPAVSLALLPLVRKVDGKAVALIWPAVLGYALAGLFLLYQVKVGRFAGEAYEPYADDLLRALGITREQAYPLSVITQSLLFFRYWLLWLLPDPSAMSITMGAGFARELSSWPQLAGPVLFIAYLAVSIWLLRRRGEHGLLGFALLVPALLFPVELATVRIQEIFVLYRSYLWMPCLAVALPYLTRRVSAKVALAALLLISVLLAAASVSRLKMLADPVLLWREALEHTLASETRSPFTLGRAHHNLGQAYINRDQYAEALPHLNAAIQLEPDQSGMYNDRAVTYFLLKRFPEALQDYGRAIALEPFAPLAYFGRAELYVAANRFAEARDDYSYSCRLGKKEACEALDSQKFGDASVAFRH